MTMTMTRLPSPSQSTAPVPALSPLVYPQDKGAITPSHGVDRRWRFRPVGRALSTVFASQTATTCYILLCHRSFHSTSSVVSSLPLDPTPPSCSSSRLLFDPAGSMILAPLTRGGNLPFRRLCADFGCRTSLSEMVYARHLLKGDGVERARLRRASNEEHFGVQIATNNVEEGAAAMRMAREAGADFVDLNCGCPINEATRRGLGSSLLRSPAKLGRLVGGIVSANDSRIPLTVKIRLGCEDDTVNVEEVVRSLREAGAAAVTIHGRTAQNRYSKPCDWERIRQVVELEKPHGMPIIGNGDILTHYEARRRLAQSGVDAVMVGRGALMKPWIFKEFADDTDWNPDLRERVTIYRTLAVYMKEHFGDDAMGKKKAWNFLPWHFEFLCRYKHLPEDEYGLMSETKPLIQNRDTNSTFATNDSSPLEMLLSCKDTAVHKRIAHELWESSSDSNAVDSLTSFAESIEFERMLREGSSRAEDAAEEKEELSNIPRGRDDRRRGRNPKPQRNPEEIRIVRAERAAKKAALLAAGGNDDNSPVSFTEIGPLKDQAGVIKRWIAGRSRNFGFIGSEGMKGEVICPEDSLVTKDDFLPLLQTEKRTLSVKIVFDTEAYETEDKTMDCRAVNVRLIDNSR